MVLVDTTSRRQIVTGDQFIPSETTMQDIKLLSKIIDNCPVAIFVMDCAHAIVHWNKACESATGWPAEKLLGTHHAWKPFYPTKRPVMADLIIDGKMDAVAELYKDKCHPSPILANAWEAEDFFPHFPGGGRWLAFTASALYDDGGSLIGAIETLRDITMRKTRKRHGGKADSCYRK
jgi:PAS domain-containing protein